MTPETDPLSWLRRPAPPGRLPRGELWLYDQVFRDLGISSDLCGHALLRRSAGMELWFLSVGDDPPAYPGYRTFRPDELRLLGELPPPPFLGLIVDGPLGREIRRLGLTTALEPLALSGTRGRSRDVFASAVRAITSLIRATAGYGTAVVVADDLAGQDRPLAHPAALRGTLLPCYARLAAAIHASGRLALFHSDGALTDLVAPLREAGFDGLAGYEVEILDVAAARRRTGREWLFIGGLPAAWMSAGPPSATICRTHVRRVAGGEGAWALATSCGIENGGAWHNLLRCYRALPAV